MQHLYRCHLTYTDAFPNNIGGFLKNLYDDAVKNMLSPVHMDQEQVCKVYKEACIPYQDKLQLHVDF